MDVEAVVKETKEEARRTFVISLRRKQLNIIFTVGLLDFLI